MTAMEIAKQFGLLPKDVIAFIDVNATFPVKRNSKTGEISIPDDVDISAFIAPLLNKESLDKCERSKREKEAIIRKEQLAVEAKIQQKNRERQETEKENAVAINSLKKMGAEA